MNNEYEKLYNTDNIFGDFYHSPKFTKLKYDACMNTECHSFIGENTT